MVNVIVTGVAGRMGGTILRMMRGADGIRVVGGVERPGWSGPGDAGEAAGMGKIGAPVSDDLAALLGRVKADVVVDFTSPEASVHHASVAAGAGVAMVIGSTGLQAAAKARIQQDAARIPVVLSPNMSVGVNVMFALVAQAARTLGDAYDVEIVEMHHGKQKDAPSGTAVRLAEVAAEALHRDPAKDVVYARHGMVGERTPREIGVMTLRGGDVVGEHTVFFAGQGERVEITHRATSRDQFARGALRAAVWVKGRAPGLYDMHDVLGLREAR
ncbi:MAG TPA: 4-hydroxy-tetrahydrodipicolinate reductase [Anaeromyxobacteraceae bacterium]|nr:4-hydroxy-tetrahydrodipicolinate reductase [Anaeromyxobacteraceae bacterium]